MARLTRLHPGGSLIAGLVVAVTLTLWLVWELGEVWHAGGALGVLGLYLMIVLGLMVWLQVWAWWRELRQRRHPPPEVGGKTEDSPQGPAMSSTDPLGDPEIFFIHDPGHPLASHLKLSRRYRYKTPRPRRRI